MEEADYRALCRELFHEFGGMHQRISHVMDKAMGGEMAVMRALMLAGGTLTPSELADRAWVSNARIANILRSLENKGWIVREHSQEDRRRVNVTITDEGRRNLEHKRELFDKRAAAFLEQLGEEDTKEMVRLLHRTNQIIDSNQKERSRIHEDR